MLLTILYPNSHRYVQPMVLQHCSKITSLLASNTSPLTMSCAKYAKCKKSNVIYKPYTPKCYPDHDLKNMALGRPMSPGLTIYGPAWTGVMSIGQRVSGAILTGYAALLCGGALFLPCGIHTYVNFIQDLELSSTKVFILKVLVASPYSFHMFNGIRFCMWNLGKWLDIKQVYTTGKIAFLASIILSFGYGFL